MEVSWSIQFQWLYIQNNKITTAVMKFCIARMVVLVQQNHEFSIRRGGFHKTLILKNALEHSFQIHRYILIWNIHMN